MDRTPSVHKPAFRTDGKGQPKTGRVKASGGLRVSPKRAPSSGQPVNLRARAALLLGEILDRRQSLKRVLQKEQEKLSRDEDRALLREMVAGVIRHLPFIDWALEENTKRGLADTQAELLEILRVGAFQILFLDRVPAYAAVDQCVEAAKVLNPGAGGFVNGILRSLAERREDILEAPYCFDGEEGDALKLGMPRWLIRRYEERFGKDEAEALLTALQKPAATTLVFPSAGAASQASSILMREGYLLRPDPILPLTCSVERGNPSASAAFQRGLFYIMDPASQSPAALLPLENVERVLDLCAAPGGKTILLANRLASKGWVLATDLNPRRLGHVAENIGRLGLKNVRLAQVNVEAGLPFKADWPAVILDAPCSSMGTLRRNPEIRWQVVPEAFRAHADRQHVFLHQASRAVAPGGILAYSVCSIEPEETREVTLRFLESHEDFKPLKLAPPGPWRNLLSMDGPGSAYLLPHRHPWDAFYVAFFKRAR